jgi:GWxTD domain-containing protein
MANFLSQFWVQKLGWALLHFLWQGTAIAISFAMLRRLLERSLAPQGRYILACLALAAMTVAPVLTFLMVPAPSAAPITLWSVSASEWQRSLPAVVVLWLLGVVVFSLRLAGAWRFTARLRSAAHPAPAEWQQTVERIAACVGARQAVRLLISSMVDVPTVIGWLRPVILVPVEFFTGVPVEHIKALLAHEIAHVRRRDYLMSMLQSIAEAVLFYHPAVWWISEQIRAERELCCDDIAVAVGGDLLTYARALTELESRQPVRLKTALAASGGSLVNRIRRLIEPESVRARGNNLPGPGAAWAMILLWIAGVGVSAMHAAQTPIIVPHPLQLSPDPLPTLASHARNTLLFDPFLSAQLQQPAPAETDRAKKEAALKRELETPWKKWLNEDVAYIIKDEERKAFEQLNTDAEREQFIEQFWLRRDPTPDTVENEFKQEHYRRIAIANQLFGGATPGWKSDRGLVYITFGPPDNSMIMLPPDAERFKMAPFEGWTYKHVAGVGDNFTITFSDVTGTGEYVMTADRRPKGVTVAESQTAALSPFERLRQFVHLQPGQPTLKIGSLAAYALKMQVRVDYLRLTAASVLANITVQFDPRDLPTDARNGKASVTITGHVSTMEGRAVSTFEKALEQQSTVAAESVPLEPGRYELKVLARDAVSGRLGTYDTEIDVPHFDEDTLAMSSLILADILHRVPARSLRADDPAVAQRIADAMFTIGDTTVRARAGNRFTTEEKLGIYLQIYNFQPDATTRRPSGAIEYEIDNAVSNEKVMGFSEDAMSFPNASASQVTIDKLLSLKTFQPGTYTLRVTATDRVAKRTVEQRGSFTVNAASSR